MSVLGHGLSVLRKPPRPRLFCFALNALRGLELGNL